MTQNKILAAGGVLLVALIFFFAIKPYFSATHAPSAGKLATLQKQWEFQAGGAIKGALALDGDSALYAASDDGFLYALDLHGSLQWKTHIGPSMSAPSIGPDGAIYISTNNGRVVAVNRSGTVRWSTEVYRGNTYGQNGSALDQNYIYAPARGSICELRLSDGQMQWDGEFLGGEQWGSVTLEADGTILSPGRGRLNALNSRGEVQWQSPPLTPEQTEKNGGLPPPGSFFVTSGIAVAGDGTLLAAASNSLVALHRDGSRKWEFKASGASLRATPVVAADGTIYFPDGYLTLYALDPDGNTRWSLRLFDTVSTTPVLAQDGTLFVLGNNFLDAVSPDGRLLAQSQTGELSSESAPTISSDGTVFISGSNGKICAFAGGHGALMSSSWPKYQADLANSGAARLP